MCMSREVRQWHNGMTMIKVEEAIGTHLAHDITEIRPGFFKGPRFRRGHKVREKDVRRLLELGKRHLYILDLASDQVHEDDAVVELANALKGPGITFEGEPKEGKIQLKASCKGLFKVNTRALMDFNLISDVMCAALHNNVPVSEGQIVAGTRIMPLVIQRQVLRGAVAIALEQSPIFSIKTYHRKKIRLIITGNEVYDGLIEDRFQAVIEKKLNGYDGSLVETVILPDDSDSIAATLCRFIEDDTDMIVTSGGMSVDPDDVTRHGVSRSGVDAMYYGSAVLPGAMLQLAYKGTVPIVSIPACALHHQTTVFDLVLPRLLAGEIVDDRDLARFAVGGLCLDCPECRYPVCPLGKTGMY